MSIKERIQHLKERHAIVCGVTIEKCICGWYPCAQCSKFRGCLKDNVLDKLPKPGENFDCFKAKE
uniref:Uncharacterized protein n=1 Tax=viral metagenome TaxID=1070528 RepID=A0A6H1Z9D3_9ZZZZ